MAQQWGPLPPAPEMPAWVRCECCDDFLCTIHGVHVADCSCPDIDTWALRGMDPYTQGGQPHTLMA